MAPCESSAQGATKSGPPPELEEGSTRARTDFWSRVRSRRKSIVDEYIFDVHEEFAATCMCMSHNGLLDNQKMRFYAESTQTAASDSVLFCSKPTIALYSKKLFPSILLCIAVLVLAGGNKNLRVYNSSHVQTSAKFRFTALTLRSGSPAAERAGSTRVWKSKQSSFIFSFGLLMHGCSSCHPQPVNEEHRGASSTISFEKPVEMDGFYFVTNTDEAGLDPLSFVVHAQTPDGAWKQVGSSTYQAGHTDAVPGPFPVPTERKAMVKYDLRPRSWGWIHLNVTNSLLIGSYLLTISALGMFTYRQDLIYPIITSVYLLNSLLWLLATQDNDYNIRHLATACFVTYGLAGAIMFCGEQYLWVFILELGAGLFCSSLYARNVLWEGSGWHETPNILLFYGVIMLLAVAYSWISYLLVLSRSRELIRPDKEKYNEVWKELTEDAAQTAQLEQLKHNVEAMSARIKGTQGKGGPRQMVRGFVATDKFFEDPIGFHKMNMRGEACREEESLSHLFLCARFVHPILVAKVEGWAEQSGGLFRVAGEGGAAAYAGWGGASEAEKAAMRMQFARLKRPSRAVAKTVRSYGGSVSRLLDICRQSIVFERTADLARCVAQIAHDREVVVERVKNRMDPDLDSTNANFTGYRDVLVNLRIMVESTKKIGAETHVCEVQLVLKKIAELKNNEGHKRYVEFRNCRAE